MPPAKGPYIMPDGKPMRGVEEAVPQGKQRTTTKRGKDLLLAQIMQERLRLISQAASPPDAAEVAELNVLAAVGARRRRRWNNERVLRELAGPMTAEEMHSQFNPVPFGFRAPTAFEIVTRPQHAHVWEGFRNVDIDREARVLQRWEQHNKEQAASARRAQQASSHAGGAAGVSSGQRHREQAADALRRWAGVSRKARAALRKANVHTVLGLESQLLDHLDASAAASSGKTQQDSEFSVPPLAMPGLDAWGRLLVHGLAEFHGLSSSTRSYSRPATNPTNNTNNTNNTTNAQQQQQQQQEQGPGSGTLEPQNQQQQQQQQGCEGSANDGEGDAEAVVITVFQRRPRHAQSSSSEQQQPEQQQLPQEPEPGAHEKISCSDVLMALSESRNSGSLSVQQLAGFVKAHIHGSETSSVANAGEPSAGWVLV